MAVKDAQMEKHAVLQKAVGMEARRVREDARLNQALVILIRCAVAILCAGNFVVALAGAKFISF